MFNLSAIVVVVFFLAVVTELLVSILGERQLYELKDTKVNVVLGLWALGAGFCSRIIEFFFFTLVFYLSPFDAGNSWLALITCMVGNELVHYFFHRWGHEWNLLWAFHITHHSSKKYNLSVAHRLNTHMTHRFLFWAPLAIFFNPLMVIFADSISQIYMFFIHTELIKKLGPLEKIFNTPSHHRVHHGTQPQYIDKNYGGILIIWDKIFGTFEPEREKPIYGLTKEMNSTNPVKVASHGWVDLIREARKQESFGKSLKYLFQKPG